MNQNPWSSRFLLVAIFSFLMTDSSFVLAHGEDQPGPNGGEIRMPGAFHTEILVQGKDQVRVYLLDMDWKNPTVNESKVEVSHLIDIAGKTKRHHAQCLKKNDFYLCRFLKDVDLAKGGRLQVTAQREKQKGNVVTYDLPLKFKGTEKGKSTGHSDHSGH